MPVPEALRRVGVQKAIVFAVGMLPMVGLVVSLFADPSPDPYERIAHVTGENALRLLVLTMLFTPVACTTGWRRIMPFRRTVGVLCFAYVLVHGLAYLFFEAGFDPVFVKDDVAMRNFIALGVAAFVLMLPMAVTSNNWSVRRLRKRWCTVHMLAYPVAILAPLHLLVLHRDEDLTEPIVYLVIFIALLSYRVVRAMGRRRARQPAAG